LPALKKGRQGGLFDVRTAETIQLFCSVEILAKGRQLRRLLATGL
jgi:hypothetical protein